jgi:hypothetical protein
MFHLLTTAKRLRIALLVATAIPGAGYLSFTLGGTTTRGGAFGGGKIN